MSDGSDDRSARVDIMRTMIVLSVRDYQRGILSKDKLALLFEICGVSYRIKDIPKRPLLSNRFVSRYIDWVNL